jgi:hypothetical protein
LNYLLNIVLIIPYNKTKGAATIDATPIPISPRKNIKIMSPTQKPIIENPSSKLIGTINSPIAAKQHNNNHRVVKLHLSFQYTKVIIKQASINNK